MYLRACQTCICIGQAKMISNNSKSCAECGEVKPLDGFQGGPRCNDCTRALNRARQKEYYAANKEKANARSKRNYEAREARKACLAAESMPEPVHDTPTTKLCVQCCAEKPVEEFGGKNRTLKSGTVKRYLHSKCKTCSAKPKVVNQPPTSKLCRACGTVKDKQSFTKTTYKVQSGEVKETIASYCKTCVAARNKLYYMRNREKAIAQSKQWRQDNREKSREWHRNYARLEKQRKYKRKWVDTNRERHNKNLRMWKKKNYDRPERIIRSAISARLRYVINKDMHTEEYLGVSFGIVQDWLEFNFTDGMTWANKRSTWDIDHVIPVDCFDIEDPQECAMCFSWMNICPLEKHRNNKKRNRILPARIFYQEAMLRRFVAARPELSDDTKSYIKEYARMFGKLLSSCDTILGFS